MASVAAHKATPTRKTPTTTARSAAHKAAPTRRELRRRNTWQRRIALSALFALFATGMAGVMVNGTSPSAYGAAKPFTSTASTLDLSDATPSASRDSIRDTTTTPVDGTWTLSSGETNMDAEGMVGYAARNKTVQDLMNHRDKAYIPAGFDPDHADGDTGNAYSFSQCTWWAYKRRHQLGLPAGSHMGNGAQWAATARRLGYWVDRQPRQGDVMVFKPGQAGSSLFYGHVAIVEQVNDDGSIVTSECGAAYHGEPFSRTFPASEVGDYEYVHY